MCICYVSPTKRKLREYRKLFSPLVALGWVLVADRRANSLIIRCTQETPLGGYGSEEGMWRQTVLYQASHHVGNWSVVCWGALGASVVHLLWNYPSQWVSKLRHLGTSAYQPLVEGCFWEVVSPQNFPLSWNLGGLWVGQQLYLLHS